jgi:nucleotide-binding universal stress UspA family protein
MTNRAIVVGLDESSSSRAALEWAAKHARLTGRVLRAVHVLDWPYGLDEADVMPGRPTGRILTHEEIEDLYRGRITRLFDELHPKPDWLMQFAQGEVGPALVHQAERAALLVVGTREHVGLGRLLSGSVSHYCLSHALCPIVAVPAPSPLAGSSDRRRTTRSPDRLPAPSE